MTQNTTDTGRGEPAVRPYNEKPKVNPWMVLALVCLPVFIGALDLTIVSAFLPAVIIELELPLQTGLDDAAWVVSGYLLAYTVSMTFMGRVSDLIGRRKVYIACLLIFIVGSILVAAAHQGPSDLLYSIYRRLGQRPDRNEVTLQAIIIGRVVQALGAGALVPVSLALVGDLFPPERRAQPLGIIGAVDTLGWVLGHLYGGILVQYTAWQNLFWLNVPITLIALFFTWRVLRDVPEHRAQGRFDFLGTALIVGALICLNVGLGANIEVSGATADFSELAALPSYAIPVLLAGVGLLIAFIWVERRVHYPLIDLSMFRQRSVSAGSATNLFVGFCLMIGLVSVPILTNIRLEDSTHLNEGARQAGILLSALTVPMALAAVPGGWLSERIGYTKTAMLGLGLALVGFLLIWQTWTVDVDNLRVALEMAIVGVGMGLTFSPVSAAVINATDEDKLGVASALVIILRLVGMTISVSALTTLALQRVTLLAATQLGQTAVDPMLAQETYVQVTVQVLGEMGLLGAVVCGIALIPAYWLRVRKDVREVEREGTAAQVTGD
jgi:MFS family permease